MGVNLGGLIPATPVSLEELAGRKLAVDANNVLYQFMASIRGPDGSPLTDSQGRTTSHLNGLFNRVTSLLTQGLKLVFVFDGPPHPLKGATLQARRDRKVTAQQEYEAALAAGDMETARTKAAQAIYLTPEMEQEAKQLLEALGVPWVQATGEGEATGAAMARRGEVWAVASQDFDCLLFGTPRLVRNLTLSGRRKLPRQDRYVTVEPEVIDLSAGLETASLTRKQLVDIALLIGTDFNPGRYRVGPKTAEKLIREFGSLAETLEQKEWDLQDWQEARGIFIEPQVTPSENYQLEWKAPNRHATIQLLCEEHDFGRARVDTMLNKLKAPKLPQRGAQASLGDF